MRPRHEGRLTGDADQIVVGSAEASRLSVKAVIDRVDELLHGLLTLELLQPLASVGAGIARQPELS
jgi:hypothetical protein